MNPTVKRSKALSIAESSRYLENDIWTTISLMEDVDPRYLEAENLFHEAILKIREARTVLFRILVDIEATVEG